MVTRWEAMVRFATAPDNPGEVASQLAPMLRFDQIRVAEHGDLEITLRVDAFDAYAAARRALDRIQAATAESEFAAPELVHVSVSSVRDGEPVSPPMSRG